MSLLVGRPVEAPEGQRAGTTAAPSAGGSPTPRPRWWRWVAVVVALGLAYVALPWTVRLGQEVEPGLPVQSGLLVDEFGDRGTQFLAYEYGETVTMTVPLTNQGPLPVTVEDVRLVEPDYPLLAPVATGGGLEIGPFAQGEAALTFRYTNCRYYHERAAQTFDQVTVTGTVLGREFTETVTLDRPLAVHAQVILNCPERTLVRGDDVRVPLPAPGRG